MTPPPQIVKMAATAATPNTEPWLYQPVTAALLADIIKKGGNLVKFKKQWKLAKEVGDFLFPQQPHMAVWYADGETWNRAYGKGITQFHIPQPPPMPTSHHYPHASATSTSSSIATAPPINKATDPHIIYCPTCSQPMPTRAEEPANHPPPPPMKDAEPAAKELPRARVKLPPSPELLATTTTGAPQTKIPSIAEKPPAVSLPHGKLSDDGSLPTTATAPIEPPSSSSLSQKSAKFPPTAAPPVKSLPMPAHQTFKSPSLGVSPSEPIPQPRDSSHDKPWLAAPGTKLDATIDKNETILLLKPEFADMPMFARRVRGVSIPRAIAAYEGRNKSTVDALGEGMQIQFKYVICKDNSLIVYPEPMPTATYIDRKLAIMLQKAGRLLQEWGMDAVHSGCPPLAKVYAKNRGLWGLPYIEAFREFYVEEPISLQRPASNRLGPGVNKHFQQHPDDAGEVFRSILKTSIAKTVFAEPSTSPQVDQTTDGEAKYVKPPLFVVEMDPSVISAVHSPEKTTGDGAANQIQLPNSTIGSADEVLVRKSALRKLRNARNIDRRQRGLPQLSLDQEYLTKQLDDEINAVNDAQAAGPGKTSPFSRSLLSLDEFLASIRKSYPAFTPTHVQEKAVASRRSFWIVQAGLTDEEYESMKAEALSHAQESNKSTESQGSSSNTRGGIMNSKSHRGGLAGGDQRGAIQPGGGCGRGRGRGRGRGSG